MKNSGFSLLEVVISIAVLSFISVFILEMFVASSNLNKRAKDADIAAAEAVSAIEGFKNHTDMAGYLEDNAGWKKSEDDAIMIYMYYDKDWNRIENETDTVDTDSGVRYCLRMEITAEDFYPERKDEVVYGELYSASADVTDLLMDEGRATLVALRSKKYFPGNS